MPDEQNFQQINVTRLLELLLQARETRDYEAFSALLSPKLAHMMTHSIFEKHCSTLDLGNCVEKQFLTQLHRDRQTLYVWASHFERSDDDFLVTLCPIFIDPQQAIADAFWIF